jgi:hypothetical protein
MQAARKPATSQAAAGELATLGELMANVAAEMAALAARGHGLQPLMERAIASATAEADIRDAQDLDKLVQALEEMAGFFNRLAASEAAGIKVEIGRLREGILLGELQRRLFSHEASFDFSAAGELDLF